MECWGGDCSYSNLLLSFDCARSSSLCRKWTHATVTHLLIQMRMCVAQRIGGDLEHAVERPIHLHYEEYGAANRQRANEEDRKQPWRSEERTTRSSRM